MLAAQLRQLIELAGVHPYVRLQVVPFRRRAHAALPTAEVPGCLVVGAQLSLGGGGRDQRARPAEAVPGVLVGRDRFRQ